MLGSVEELYNYVLEAEDSELGRCKDFLSDDQFWTVRYMVADTRKWLPDRKLNEQSKENIFRRRRYFFSAAFVSAHQNAKLCFLFISSLSSMAARIPKNVRRPTTAPHPH